MQASDIAAALDRLAPRLVGGATGVADLRRLSGGATQETWAFQVAVADRLQALILRRAPGGRGSSVMAIDPQTEARLLELARQAGAPVPPVRHVLAPEDGLGEGFVMDFVPGETIPRKLLRDNAYAQARPKLARQCGEALARIHAIPRERLPPLPALNPAEELEQLRNAYLASDCPRPVFALAFRRLAERTPSPPAELRLVHGDFRNGNLIVGPEGLRAVLDWELAHIGDPMHDLGWICVNSWRFGEIDKPVGGFGEREELYAGYEAAGGMVDRARAAWWEMLGTLRWGVMCAGMVAPFRAGADPSIERAMIARRASETEVDLMRLLDRAA